MKKGQKVYTINHTTNKAGTGVVVAVKWQFNPYPSRLYIVKQIKDGDSIADIIAKAFTGYADDLVVYSATDLVKVDG